MESGLLHCRQILYHLNHQESHECPVWQPRNCCGLLAWGCGAEGSETGESGRRAVSMVWSFSWPTRKARCRQELAEAKHLGLGSGQEWGHSILWASGSTRHFASTHCPHGLWVQESPDTWETFMGWLQEGEALHPGTSEQGPGESWQDEGT